jgi:stage II sporulation protein E
VVIKLQHGVVYVICLIGTLIGFGGGEIVIYLLTTLIFVAMILIFRPLYEDEDRNEKQKLGKYIFASTLLVQVLRMVFGTFSMSGLVSALVLAVMTYIFYKIFVNSLSVITEFGEKRAFSVEEVIGASLLVTIAFVPLADLTVFNLSITNILSIMVILFLGWKNGILAGATAGITIGMVLGLTTETNAVLISSFAISGMLAGILNRMGRIGVIVGFAVGNVILTYAAERKYDSSNNNKRNIDCITWTTCYS